MSKLDSTYWQKRYQDNNTGWDIGHISPPLKAYIDQLTNPYIKILIPGAGNAYEACYLYTKGFKNVTVLDFAKQPLENILKKIPNFPKNQLIHQDFFDHKGSYDLILEQTFFCALNPQLREAYVKKTNTLLKAKGKLTGVLFNHIFKKEGPPFGGSQREYKNLFGPYFTIKTLENCYNSIKPRQGKELFFIFEK